MYLVCQRGLPPGGGASRIHEVNLRATVGSRQ